MNAQINAKRKLLAGETVLYGFACITDPSCAEVMALCGVDIIAVDMEHRCFHEETLINISRAAAACGAACIVRTSERNPRAIGRWMDCGLDGVCATMIESYDDALGAVQAARLPPEGMRGMCANGRGGRYGIGVSTAEFTAQSNENAIVFLVIESEKGLRDLDRILTIPGIDCIDIGPGDLASSMGLPGQEKSDRVQAVIADATRKIMAAGIGTSHQPGTARELRALTAQGFRVINIGGDIVHLRNSLRQLLHGEA